MQTLMNALNDPTRRAALAILWSGREHCLCELMATLQTSQSGMSRHMKTLREAGLVVARQDAQWVRFRRNPALDPAKVAVVDAVVAAEHPKHQHERSVA